MARPYQNELGELAATLDAVCNAEISVLVNAVHEARHAPLRAIGSGGSLSAAYAVAHLHRTWAGQAAFVSTPFQVLAEPLNPEISNWIISAGGRNSDIVAVGEAILARESRRTTILTGRPENPLTKLFEAAGWVHIFAISPPMGKDGFLAVNSLFAFVCVATRAYSEAFDGGEEWNAVRARISAILNNDHFLSHLENATQILWDRPTTIVLHGAQSFVAATDLESKFTEAALGNLQISDYRNFAHGRHHWLAKRGDQSGIIAFSSYQEDDVVDRTLALIPKEIPILRVPLSVGPSAQLIEALYAALVIAGFAGKARGIDPGQPGVPEFGRKLYSLRPRKSCARPSVSDLSAQERLAIRRKARRSPDDLAKEGTLEPWAERLAQFKEKMLSATYPSLVLDFDGTIVDTNARFHPPKKPLASLISFVLERAFLGVATGRGRSAREDLRAILPKPLWGRVLVGYYNGSIIAPLDDDRAPAPSTCAGPSLSEFAAALRNDAQLSTWCRQEDRLTQITLRPESGASPDAIWRRARELASRADGSAVKMMRSGHSVDIVDAASSKLNLLDALRSIAGEGPVLAIGDRGAWPGNDLELLSTPYSLSVDEVSGDIETCWALAPAGLRGASALQFYLEALEAADGGLRFKEGAFD